MILIDIIVYGIILLIVYFFLSLLFPILRLRHIRFSIWFLKKTKLGDLENIIKTKRAYKKEIGKIFVIVLILSVIFSYFVFQNSLGNIFLSSIFVFFFLILFLLFSPVTNPYTEIIRTILYIKEKKNFSYIDKCELSGRIQIISETIKPSNSIESLFINIVPNYKSEIKFRQKIFNYSAKKISLLSYWILTANLSKREKNIIINILKIIAKDFSTFNVYNIFNSVNKLPILDKKEIKDIKALFLETEKGGIKERCRSMIEFFSVNYRGFIIIIAMILIFYFILTGNFNKILSILFSV